MSLKLPRGFGKWTSEVQRKWVMDELKKVREKEQELTAFSRRLASDGKFSMLMQEDDRPDLIELKK